MKNNNPPALGQKENAKHGEVFFPVQKYITRLAQITLSSLHTGTMRQSSH